jgi:hypothetical protein
VFSLWHMIAKSIFVTVVCIRVASFSIISAQSFIYTKKFLIDYLSKLYI